MDEKRIIVIDGHRLNVFEKCQIQTVRNTHFKTPFGETDGAVAVRGVRKYKIEVTGIPISSGLPDFYNLSGFGVTVEYNGDITVFSGCEVSEICESVLPGEKYYEKLTIVSARRVVIESGEGNLVDE